MTQNGASRTVALTGATGFIGARILDILATRQDVQLRALTRRPQLARDHVTWVAGDLHDTQALATLVRDADAIIHCAGLTKALSGAEFRSINETGARNVAEAARKQSAGRPRHFILISSLAARAPHLSDYAASKRAGEDAVLSIADDQPTTILRPPAVYGAGDEEVLKLFWAMKRGIAPQPGKRANRFGLVHVDDLAEAVCASLWQEQTYGQVLEVDDGTAEGYSMHDVARFAAAAFGRPVRVISVPSGLLWVMGAANEILPLMTGRAPMLSRNKARELAHPDWSRVGPTLNGLGIWAPSRPACTAVEDAIRGHIERGEL